MEPTGTSRSCPSDQLDIAQRIAHNMTARNRAFSAAPSSCRTWIDQRPSDRTHRWRGPCAAVHQRPYALRVPAASSAASEVTWRSVRSDIEARVLWGLPENVAADIRLVGPWRSRSGPCNGPLRTSTCIVTRQPSAQITWRPTSAALADIRCQRTMPSACGGALPVSSAVRTEPASVPVSFRSPGCSPTTDLARFGSVVPRLRGRARRSVTGVPVLVPTAVKFRYPLDS
jgi:hypothetical protein